MIPMTYNILALIFSALSTLNAELESFKLTTVPRQEENFIRLDWELMKDQPYIYKAYRKDSVNKEYQSISMIDLNKTQEIKVLNIHPNVGENVAFTTWDKESLNLPKSASLKKWMEEPNIENPKGYGKGIIDVTPIAINEFNSNYESILGNESVGYNYDIIMIGSWDTNGAKDLTNESMLHVEEFIKTGRGLLLGHDTVSQAYIGKLAKYANVEKYSKTPQINSLGVGDVQIKLTKKGFLTNYPWNIESELLNIPRTHTSSQMASKVDSWYEFVDVTDGKTVTNSIITDDLNPWKHEILYETDTHTNNFYLTTFNNVAVIQTGHSNGQATDDEQKILANTLFYLNQLSTDTYLNDISGQDISAPTAPKIANMDINSDNDNFRFNISQSEDIGTKYSYYVEAIGQNDNISKVSNKVDVEINSGIKGYSYLIDNASNTVPNNVINLNSNSTEIEYRIDDIKDKEYYLHIKAIDNAGNISEAVHYKIEDNKSPKLTLNYNTDATNQDIIVSVSASDNLDLDYLLLPNGQKVYSNTAEYVVSDNGEYTFKAIDKFNNSNTTSIHINNIDKDKPLVSIVKSSDKKWVNTGVEIVVNTND